MSEDSPQRLRPRELGALALSIALVPLNSTMLAVAIPKVASDIQVDPTKTTQWLVTGYLLVGIAFQSPGGKLSDAIGHTRALSLGQVVFTLGSLIGFFGHGLPLLVLARGLMAAGGAMVVPSAIATLRLRLPPARRARAFGAFGAVMGLAAALGPLVGGEIAGRFGWRTLFVVNAPVLVVAAFLGRLGHSSAPASEPARRRPLRLDVVGSVLLAFGLGLLVLASRSPHPVWLATGGAGLLAIFVPWELRVAHPVVDLRLFRRPVYAASLAIVGLQNLAMYSLVFMLPLVLFKLFGLEAKQAGRTLATLTIAMVAGSMIGGRLSEKIGARFAAAIGAGTATAGMVLCATVPLESAKSLVVPLILCGFGLGLTGPGSQAAGLDVVPVEQSGMAAGLSATLRYLGGVVGVAIAGPLLASGEVRERYPVLAWIFTGALALAFTATLALPSKRIAPRRG